MTTIDFVALAEQGVDAWNQWRADHPDCHPDLSRAYLYGQLLTGFDLSNVDLSRACLIGASLQRANLSGACLQSAYASSANFSEANLTGADLQQGSFSEADFSRADLSGAKVEGSGFGGACFTGACLMGWQVDHTTAFAEIKGGYLYLGASSSLRWPPSGEAHAGELEAFLRQRSQARSRVVPAVAATYRRVVSATALILNKTWAELCAVMLDLKVLLGPQAARLRYLLHQSLHQGWTWLRHLLHRGWSRGVPAVKTFAQTLWASTQLVARYLAQSSLNAYLYLQTRWLPDAHQQIQQAWTSALRKGRYWQIQTRRAQRRLMRWWQQFVLGEGYIQRLLRRSHQTLRTAFTHTSRVLRVTCIRRSQSTASTVARYTKRLHQQQQRIHSWLYRYWLARCLLLQQEWIVFLRGESVLQRRLTQLQQQRRHHFNLVGQSMQVERVRQLKALKIAIGLGRRQLRAARWRVNRYLNARGGWRAWPAYFVKSAATLIANTWKTVYRRYPIPAAVGLMAITLFGFNNRLSSSSPLSQAPASRQKTPSHIASINHAASAKPLYTEPSLSAVATASDTALPCPALELRDVTKGTGYTYEDGSVYYGQTVDNQPADGLGTMLYATGNRYDGNYQNGQRTGCGVFTYSNGQRYIGQFLADQFNGQGTWILENGERYIGEFKDNDCDGRGTFIFANGSVKSGIWQDGKLENTELLCKSGSLRVPTSPDN